ncbi:MAG TPA: PKD domain-containing protein, partial [Chitinophagaceae bacterium]|nr:PKD domain-containing protein [Chitinophagaceae bacterium]
TNGGGGCTYTGNDVVWRATAPVTVTPNTNYEYCFYLANRSTASNAKIVPAINGVPVADSFVQSRGSGDGSWTKFRFVWNSGTATTADLALFNKDTATAGNDFAIDEISFGVPYSGQSVNQPPVARAGTDTSLVLPKDSIVLNGSASSDADGHIVSYRWTKISGPTAYAIASPDSAITQVKNLVAGVYAFRLLVTDNGGATAADTIVVTVRAALSCGPLLPGIYTTDITAGVTPGSTCFTAPGTYDVKGAGDLSGFLDRFRYVYSTLTGNGVATVRVTSQDAVSPLNGAGIMFRESLNSRAAYTLLALSSGNGVYWQSQSTLGLAPSVINTGAGNIKAPYYLRLDRKGSTITGYISKDSIKWTDIGKKTMPAISKTLYIGLAVYSHSDKLLSEAVFDNWTIQGEKEADGLNLFVYPNPTNGGFALEFRLEKKQRVWITLTSGADGRICYTETLDKFSGYYHKNLDQLRLAKGNYAVTVRTETATKTIILVKY